MFCSVFIVSFSVIAFVASDSVPKIAFEAGLQNSPKVYPGTTIVFNDLRLNVIGEQSNQFGYNQATGHFVCPLSGLYSFSAHLMGNPYMEFQMMKNGKMVMPLMLDGEGISWKTDSGTKEIHCNRGENVYIKGTYAGPATLHNGWNWFSGHLIWTDL